MPQLQPLAAGRDRPGSNRIAGQRLTDEARVVFAGDDVRQHDTLRYAATMHSGQSITADSSYAIPAQVRSRAMMYAAMTQGRNTDEAFMYQRFSWEADHERARDRVLICVQ